MGPQPGILSFQLDHTQGAGHPDQPRKTFTEREHGELVESIRRNGLLQPITVTPVNGGIYMIVAGERRWRACKAVPLDHVPAVVRDLSTRQVVELALLENITRTDLTPLDEARAYQGFLDRGYSIEELAAVLGFKQPHRITERTRLLQLDDLYQEALQRGALNRSQAYEMSRLGPENQRVLWEVIKAGRCDSYEKLRRLTSALLDQENQIQLFRQPSNGRDRESFSRVDRFIAGSGRLVNLITEEDLSVLESVSRDDAPTCVARLELLQQTCSRLRQSLLTNIAKQEVQV